MYPNADYKYIYIYIILLKNVIKENIALYGVRG